MWFASIFPCGHIINTKITQKGHWDFQVKSHLNILISSLSCIEPLWQRTKWIVISSATQPILSKFPSSNTIIKNLHIISDKTYAVSWHVLFHFLLTIVNCQPYSDLNSILGDHDLKRKVHELARTLKISNVCIAVDLLPSFHNSVHLPKILPPLPWYWTPPALGISGHRGLLHTPIQNTLVVRQNQTTTSNTAQSKRLSLTDPVQTTSE